MAAGGDGEDLAGAAGTSAKNLYLQEFKLYETRSKFYIIGWDKSGTIRRVLSLDREDPSELNLQEDPTIYKKNERDDLLNRIDVGNRSSERREIGYICGHMIYAISKSEMIAIPNSTVRHNVASSKHEERFLGYFQPQKGKAALWELDSDQHYNIGIHGPSFADEKARPFRRSLSEGSMVCEITTGSSSNVEEKFSRNSFTSRCQNRGSF